MLKLRVLRKEKGREGLGHRKEGQNLWRMRLEEEAGVVSCKVLEAI